MITTIIKVKKAQLTSKVDLPYSFEISQLLNQTT